MAVSIELAAAFERAESERLLAAEKLVLTLPQLFRGLLVECDLVYRISNHFFAVVARLAEGTDGPKARARMQFWCARAGGISSCLSMLSEEERSIFDARIERCDLRIRSVGPQMLSQALARIITDAGAPADRQRSNNPQPVLLMDVGGKGWQGVFYDKAEQTLFVPGNVSPPLGDEFVLALRAAGTERPVEVRARVTGVRSPDESGPGTPAGFSLLLHAPPAVLVSAFDRAQADRISTKRTAPRYELKAPVKVINPAEAEAPDQPKAPLPHARIEYGSERELAADYVANLSQGGAFVRTAQPASMGSRLQLEMQLPEGVVLNASATVVFVNGQGMGVRFELDAAGNETLSSVIARISARPRRALVVDDDAVVRRMLADSLQARGFEVLTAEDGSVGLGIIAEEVLTLDLLVSDLKMPNLDGEAFIRTIRQVGGESELAIVVITGSPEPGMEKRLEEVGADTVLDKTLGPELIAQAADAVLERKRLGQK